MEPKLGMYLAYLLVSVALTMWVARSALHFFNLYMLNGFRRSQRLAGSVRPPVPASQHLPAHPMSSP